MTPPKSRKKSGWPPIKIDDLGPFWTIFGTFLVNLFMTPPNDKEEALTPLKNSENALYPPKKFEKGLVPTKMLKMVCAPLKTTDPLDVFYTFPKYWGWAWQIPAFDFLLVFAIWGETSLDTKYDKRDLNI